MSTRCSAASPGADVEPLAAIARRSSARPRAYFLVNTALVAAAIALVDPPADLPGVARELPLERAELLRRRASRPRALPSSSVASGYWLVPLAAPPLYLTYRTYKVYLGRIEDEQRHVQQVSDLHLATIEALARAIDAKDQIAQVAHPARAGVCGRPRARARHDRERDPGRQDRRAAARHRQAGRARAHPVEARSADAGGVPEDPRSIRRSAPTSSAPCRSRIRSRR